jgi:hypothetical protein
VSPNQPKPPPLVPDSMPVAEALRRSAPLAALRERLKESSERFEAIRASLPEGWSLLVANASVAAKLRQIRPRLETILQQRGWQVSAIRIKVQTN